MFVKLMYITKLKKVSWTSLAALGRVANAQLRTLTYTKSHERDQSWSALMIWAIIVMCSWDWRMSCTRNTNGRIATA